jgi:aspartokinase/homoserine dehydrogenase 1
MSRSITDSLSPQVFKFGGSTMASAEGTRQAVAFITDHGQASVVVVSAMGGMTSRLVSALEQASVGGLDHAQATCAFLRKTYGDLLEDCLQGDDLAGLRHVLLQQVEQNMAEFLNICSSVAILKEQTPRILDAVVARGERLYAQLFAKFLEHQGVPTVYLDATEVLFVENKMGLLGSVIQDDRCRQAVDRVLVPFLEQGKTVVLPGLIATGPAGEVVTLGLGGADYSATSLGGLLGAAKVTLFKECGGLLTADPGYVSDARVISQLHYREATELAFCGAQVLHPRTLIPLFRKKIPLALRSLDPRLGAGTLIAAENLGGEYPVRGLTSLAGQSLITVQGNGMMGVPGVAARTFSALAGAGLSVSFISQASSESSICFVVPAAASAKALEVLRAGFRDECEQGLIESITAHDEVSVVAVVGLGMKGHPGVAARTMAAIASAGVNIVAIAQGASELNISVAVQDSDTQSVLRALHREYRLHDTGARPEQRDHQANVFVHGLGQIGRAVCRQLLDQRDYLSRALHLDLRVVSLSDSGSALFHDNGFDDGVVRSILAQKSAGHPLSAMVCDHAERCDLSSGANQESVLDQILVQRKTKGLFVDATASETYPLLRSAVAFGWHVVLANKKPLAVAQADFDDLFALARDRGVAIRYEATVGAGLPVLDTLAKLRAAGDEIISVEGCLSGTLGFLVNRMTEGCLFSQAVAEAIQAGYTEPDPRDDLGGMDVARKALILARTLGMRLDLADIEVEPLFPAEIARIPSLSSMELVAALRAGLDAGMQERVAAAARQGQVLRYVASINVLENVVRVGLGALPTGSPMGRLSGSENLVLIRSKRYLSNPLVVTGPGAGAEVTAAGVLGDVVSVAEKDSLGVVVQRSIKETSLHLPKGASC